MRGFLPFLIFSSASSINAEPLDVFRDCEICPEMIELPMGEFVMGAPPDETLRKLVYRDGVLKAVTPEEPFLAMNEGPQHRVLVDISIAIGRNEVTFAEWMACVADGGCNGYVPLNLIAFSGSEEEIKWSLTNKGFADSLAGREIARAMAGDGFIRLGGDYPVIHVSYLDAQSYVDWINRKLDTNAYRLPTEAEWEYAARAGTTTRYAQGDEITPEQANFSRAMTELVLIGDFPDLLERGFPLPVTDLDAANAWGIRHMAGNVEEITQSCYTERYAGLSTLSEWRKVSISQCSEIVTRGGSYEASADDLRSAFRVWEERPDRAQGTGFRVLKDINEKEE